MARWPLRNWLAVGLVVAIPAAGSAQTTVTLPDTSQTTTISASVSEQARVSVPSGVTFNVTDIAASTAAASASVTIENIVLATATKQLGVSLRADAASFTAPVGGATTWAASAVTWNAASWTNATGAGGTLSSAAYTTVATCSADTPSCSTTGLVFTLAPNPAVKRSGAHTIVVTWKIESIGA